jgi:uncharacterized repeat protein (TIGR03803 family)
MRSTRFAHPVSRVLSVLAVMAALMGTVSAGPPQVIHSFGEEGGEYPDTDLVMDGAGNIYGTTVTGGDIGSGTVFQLTPSGDGWTHTVLHSFTSGADGGQPYKGVTLDPQGNIYGTTVVGGTGGACPEDGCGVIYKLTNSGGTWTHSVLYNFTGGDDGYGPGAGLTRDPRGNLYGMTPTGGAYGLGVIYQLRPQPGGDWKLSVIHAFTGGNDGGAGSAGRLLLRGGRFYGVATVGGEHGKGIAFELSRSSTGSWRLKTIYAFKGQPDAGFPYGAVAFDTAGNLYGTTYYDGEYNYGAVYQLSPTPSGEWKERVLYSFTGGSDGAGSISNVVFDAAGNFYGTTSEGGGGCGCGTIFKLAPGDDGQWTASTAHRFQGPPDGAFPYNGMVGDSQGNFYGATVHGGDDNDGTVYKFTP